MMDDYWSIIGPAVPEDTADQCTSHDLVREKIGRRQNLKILDLGCGDGRAVDFFRSLPNSISYTGVDIDVSPEVKSRTRSDAAFDTYDGVNLPYDDESFDIVFSHQVFEHVARPLELLGSIRRVLKPNGEFVGSVSQLEPYHSYSLWNFTLYGWAKLLASAGLTVDQLRPGIDGATLVYRSFDGRKERFSRFFKSESPLNARIDRRGKQAKLSIKQRAHRKIVYAGHLIFSARKGAAPRAPQVVVGLEPDLTKR